MQRPHNGDHPGVDRQHLKEERVLNQALKLGLDYLISVHSVVHCLELCFAFCLKASINLWTFLCTDFKE